MQGIPSLFKKTLDFLIPLRCIKCGDILGEHPGLCTRCWPLIPFISAPVCACCGLPFEFEIEDGALCGACLYERPAFTTARSVFAYTTESKELILKFKHLDVLNTLPLFVQWMARVAEEKQDILCIPVPLHRIRLFMRTYNQAALLARALAKTKGWTYLPTTLLRTRKTPSQGTLSAKERTTNVAGAFRVHENKKSALKGRTIFLIDDVFTTGATLNGCTKALRKAGAAEVHALTLSRVVKARQVG